MTSMSPMLYLSIDSQCGKPIHSSALLCLKLMEFKNVVLGVTECEIIVIENCEGGKAVLKVS